MIIFIPSFRRSIKNPAYYLCILGFALLTVAIVYSVYFSNYYTEWQPKAAICSVFNDGTKIRMCTEADCQLVKKFNVNNYKLPTQAVIHTRATTAATTTSVIEPKMLMASSSSSSEQQGECVAGVTTCYEPGWNVNSNLNEWIRTISTHMVTTNQEQALHMVQLLTNATSDTFWNCYERLDIVNWYFSDFPLLLPRTELILICVFYPLSVIAFALSCMVICLRIRAHRKNKAATAQISTQKSKPTNSKKKQTKKANEKQPLVINGQPNINPSNAIPSGNSMV